MSGDIPFKKTMKVKLKVSFSGTDKTWNAGEIMECNPGEAKRLIAAEYAEAISKEDLKKGEEVGKAIVQGITPHIVPEVKPKAAAKKKKKK